MRWQEGGKVVPAGATVWAQLVESPYLEKVCLALRLHALHVFAI